jgi:hypothetical protein
MTSPAKRNTIHATMTIDAPELNVVMPMPSFERAVKTNLPSLLLDLHSSVEFEPNSTKIQASIDWQDNEDTKAIFDALGSCPVPALDQFMPHVVNETHGFLPVPAPMARLPSFLGLDLWEGMVEDLHRLLLAGALRDRVLQVCVGGFMISARV